MNKEIAAKIESFFSSYTIRKYAKGQILILNGEDTNYIYYLVSGGVKQYDVTYRGDEIVLNVFKPRTFFPMSLAINNTPNPYIYEAEAEIEVRQAPAAAVVTFIKQNPDVMFDLLARVYHGVDGILGRMTQIMAGSAKSRLVYELILEVRRFGSHLADGSRKLVLSEKDLGARAGLSRETVSREIHKLKDENLIEIRNKDIIIKDLGALELKLGQVI